MQWLCGCFDPTAEFGLPDHKFLRLLGHGNEGEVWLTRDKSGKLSGAQARAHCPRRARRAD